MMIPVAATNSGYHRRRLQKINLCILVLFFLIVGPSVVVAQPSNNGTSSGGGGGGGNNKNGNYNNLYNFNPSMAIIIVVLISAFFFLGFFSIYIRNCAGSNSGAAAAVARAGGALGLSRRQRGLDAELLETFPTLVYSEVKGLKIGKAALECAVCLCEFEDEDTLRLLPACSHVFHPDCIDAWLASHVTCPVCRANLSQPVTAGEATGPAASPPVQEDALQPEFVSIRIDEASTESGTAALLPPPELVELRRLTSQRQAQRTKSLKRPSRFPRSHSTGHSIVQQEENVDRYTLRLPEHIRKEIVAVGRLQRTKSFPANSPAAEGSTRRGPRWGSIGGEEGSRAGRSVRLGRVDRWPSMLMRTISSRVPAWATGRKPDGEGGVKKAGGGGGGVGWEAEGSTKGRVAGPLRGPFECLGGGSNSNSASGRAHVDASDSESANESPTVPLARV